MESQQKDNNTDLFKISDWEKDPDRNHKLEKSMKYLCSEVKDKDTYLDLSQRIMQHLQQEFQKKETAADDDELFLPWVRFLDISAAKTVDLLFRSSKTESEDDFIPLFLNNKEFDSFRQGIEDLIIRILSEGGTRQKDSINTMDWRIAKKILNVPNIFPKQSHLLPLINKTDLLKAFQREIDKALEDSAWLRLNSLTRTAKSTLEKLHEYSLDKSFHDRFIQAIIVGRFDKAIFTEFSNSLISGEDGGLFLLLNTFTKEHQKDLVEENIVTEDYLKDKIKKKIIMN